MRRITGNDSKNFLLHLSQSNESGISGRRPRGAALRLVPPWLGQAPRTRRPPRAKQTKASHQTRTPQPRDQAQRTRRLPHTGRTWGLPRKLGRRALGIWHPRGATAWASQQTRTPYLRNLTQRTQRLPPSGHTQGQPADSDTIPSDSDSENTKTTSSGHTQGQPADSDVVPSESVSHECCPTLLCRLGRPDPAVATAALRADQSTQCPSQCDMPGLPIHPCSEERPGNLKLKSVVHTTLCRNAQQTVCDDIRVPPPLTVLDCTALLCSVTLRAHPRIPRRRILKEQRRKPERHMRCRVLHTGGYANGSSAEYHADVNWCGQWMVIREWGLVEVIEAQGGLE